MSTSSATKSAAATLAANIRRARADLDMTQAELAAKLGLSDPQRVSDWERGVHRPSLGKLVALAEAREVGLDWFYVDHGAEVAA